jgi:acetyl-CoA C-acetyltransferase
MLKSNAYILDAARTPRGRGKAGKGSLHGVHPQELFAQVLTGLEKRGTFRATDVDDVVAGVVSQVGEQGANVARNAVLAAGFPIEVSAASLNRFCGSGLQAINFAAMGVASGAQNLVVAGGVESMSRVPMGSDGGGQDGDNAALREHFFQVPQGISADLIATLDGVSRGDVDWFALSSQRKAAAAVEERRFARSLLSVVDRASGRTLLERDELVRPDTTLGALATLPASFESLGRMQLGANGETLDEIALAHMATQGRALARIDHVHTAGNSSGLADGAAAVVVASEHYLRTHDVKPRARIRSFATVGSDPVLMLTAPAPVAKKALALAGMSADDIDLWEINEAFASVVVQTMRALALDPAKVNVNGGAIALGHPLGATGAILVGAALDELERANKSTALVTMCIGGGQGIATILERM